MEILVGVVITLCVGWLAARSPRSDTVDAELHAILASLTDHVLVLDRDGLCLRRYAGAHAASNPVHEQGRSLHEILSLREAEEALAVIRWVILSDAPATYEYSHNTGGKVRWTRASVARLPTRDGAVIWRARDITECRETEAQLRLAQRLSSVGAKAGAVVHDLNNMLTVISAHADLLLQAAPGDDPRRRDVHKIKRCTQRAAQLTGQLLAAGRDAPMASDAVDLNAVVKTSVRMLRPVLGDNVSLDLKLDDGLARVRADADQLERVLVNLVLNARDALQSKPGTICISTRNLDVDRSRAEQTPGLVAGEFVRVSVRDNGTGMTGDVQARIFEPLFTMKEPGRGTGLGLFSVHSIVKRANGCIHVSSTPGEGSTFEVLLPRLRQPACGLP